MDDQTIIELYWARAEDAIRETAEKYEGLCRFIIGRILLCREDVEECLNDIWLGLWNSIPPERPRHFGTFIGRVARNQALKKYHYLSAAKRNPQAVCSLEELGECVSGGNCIENELENRRVELAINDFLWQLSEEKRNIFLRRYWYFDSIEEISRSTGFSRSKVKSILHRLRLGLRAHLEKEGIEV